MNTIKNRLSTIVFYLSILFFIIGFNVNDTPPSGWYQQFMPSIGGKQISDITFLDSLTGYAVATQTSDSSYILKTTNGGENWQIIHRQLFAMTQIQFLDLNTGYAGGGYLYKTIDGGFNWPQINTPLVTVENIFVRNQDTIWFVYHNSFDGGVYRTINGGGSWIRQYNGGTSNPIRIYMHPNAMLGFYTTQGGNMFRTTDGGFNWTPAGTNDAFTDMYFLNDLTGFRSWGTMRKTTDGGFNWVTQPLPYDPNIVNSILEFTVLNIDTIWGPGGYYFFAPGRTRGIIYKTVNGGLNWGYQMPDTSINIARYYYGKFVNKLNGWSYHALPTGVHTVTGGDTITYMGASKIEGKIPYSFSLSQNYPNPFNPQTNIKYQIVNSSHVKLSAYDISGKEIKSLVNQKENSGTYEVTFDGSGLSSGVYFYRIQITSEKGGETFSETKKMILIK